MLAGDPLVWAAVEALCPEVWTTLHTPRTVAEHAWELWEPIPPPRSEATWRARAHLLDALGEVLDGHPDRNGALAEFSDGPVLQTGDHCQLVCDPVSFATNLVYHLGARLRGRRHLMVNACSTVTLETRNATGPGWLSVEGARVNVFGLGRRTLARTSVCAEARPCRFELATPETANSAAREALESLRGLLGDQVHPSPTSAFLDANPRLWRSWGGETELAYTDDRLTALAVARNLTDPDSLLRRLLFEPVLSSAFDAALQRARTGAGRYALRGSTDGFWALLDGRVRPVVRRGEELVAVSAGRETAIPFEADAIAAALRQGLLYPDLVVGFLALSVLPRVKVLGGTSQLVYLRVLRHALREALEGLPALADELSAPTDGWIVGVLDAETVAPPCRPDATLLPRAARAWADVPLARGVGPGRIFSYLPRWRIP